MSAYLTYCKEIEGKPYKIIPNVVKLKTQIRYTMAKILNILRSGQF